MKYVLDSNIYIEAYKRYYAFDIAPCFWTELDNQLIKGKVVCIDRVRNELSKQKDQLSGWINARDCTLVKTNDDDTIASYTEIMQWATNNKNFTNAAKAEFAEVTDGWIVAMLKLMDIQLPHMRSMIPISKLKFLMHVMIPLKKPPIIGCFLKDFRSRRRIY